MKAAQISKAGGDFELVEREIPEPGPGQVRVKVEACGICHSDVLVKDGLWPGLQISAGAGPRSCRPCRCSWSGSHDLEKRRSRRGRLARRP